MARGRSTTHQVAEFGVGSEKVTTVGGSAVESFSFEAAKLGDIAVALVETRGAVPVVVESAKVSAEGQVEVTFDADPSNDHVVSLLVFKQS